MKLLSLQISLSLNKRSEVCEKVLRVPTVEKDFVLGTNFPVFLHFQDHAHIKSTKLFFNITITWFVKLLTDRLNN